MTSTTFFIIFIPILAILLLAINLILAPHNPYQEKDSVFECGFHSFLGQNRTQFSVSFFIFALLFLLFDLEILLVYPYSVSGYTNDIYGLATMMVFFVLLTLGFIFELGKNALTIDSRQTSSYTSVDTTISHVFLTGKFSGVSMPDLSKREYTILMLVVVPTVLLAIYPSSILDGLAYSVSTLLYHSDLLVAASSGPLTNTTLEQRVEQFDKTVDTVSSVSKLRAEAQDDAAVLTANVNREGQDIIAKKESLIADLQNAGDHDSISIVKDACTQSLGVLNEAASVALQQIENGQPNAEAVLLLFNFAGLEFLAVLSLFVSVLLNLYSNKSFRYAFIILLSSFKR